MESIGEIFHFKSIRFASQSVCIKFMFLNCQMTCYVIVFILSFAIHIRLFTGIRMKMFSLTFKKLSY